MEWGEGSHCHDGAVSSQEKPLQAGRPHLQGGGQLKVAGSYKPEGLVLPTLRSQPQERWADGTAATGMLASWGWAELAAVLGGPYLVI